MEQLVSFWLEIACHLEENQIVCRPGMIISKSTDHTISKTPNSPFFFLIWHPLSGVSLMRAVQVP